MFNDLFKSVPPAVRKKLQKRLEMLVLTLDESKVADVKAVVRLAQEFRKPVKR